MEQIQSLIKLAKRVSDPEILEMLYVLIEKIDDNEERISLSRTVRDIASRKEEEFLKKSSKYMSRGNEYKAIEQYDNYERVTNIIEMFLKLNAQVDFDSYCLFMEFNREPEKRFYQPRRHVLFKHVVPHLQDLADEKLDFLSISMPPRTGKSTLCIFFLTWIMGRNPERANLMTGHSDKLTEGFYEEALSIITDPYTYRFAEVFPEARFIAKSAKNETINLKTKSRFPTLTCRSIEGTLTGAVEVGKDALLYMDDLVEDREQALNVDRMDKLYAAYLNQLKDRMNDGAKQLCVATRWVPNDPIGRIEEQYEGNKRYRFICVPALNENDETNFDYLFGKGFSTAYYHDMRQSLIDAGEEDSWSAKYMCAPYWMTGLMFPADELNYFSELPSEEPDAIWAACDTKDRGKDYACLPVGYQYGDKHFIVDVVCDNSLPDIVEPKLVKTLIKNNVNKARFESNSAGGHIADDVQDKCREAGLPITIDKKYSVSNKETRILADSGWIKQNCFFLADPQTTDYKKFMNLLTHYTVSGKNAHDDAPDAMSMYSRFVKSLIKAKCEAVKRLPI